MEKRDIIVVEHEVMLQSGETLTVRADSYRFYNNGVEWHLNNKMVCSLDAHKIDFIGIRVYKNGALVYEGKP